jgi:AcrR family transcriptional regulator
MSGKTRTVTVESVLIAAVRITEAHGLPNLNIQQLAVELGIKPASLYNHIKGIDEVKANVAKYGIGELEKVMRDAAVGYAREEAILRIALAARDFAAARPGLYSAVNLYSLVSAADYKKMMSTHMNVMHQILDTYNLDSDIKRNFLIAYRSGLHGFVSLEAVGAFGDNMNTDEIFKKMMVHLIKMLEETDNGKAK